VAPGVENAKQDIRNLTDEYKNFLLTAATAPIGRSLDDILSDPISRRQFFKRKHPADQLYPPEDARMIWDALIEAGLDPRFDRWGHPGSQWPGPHINYSGGGHISVQPGFEP
jgi:hypothetical protein